MSRVVFLVNPASAGGSTGRRWPELARQAARLGLAGDARFSEDPAHLRELAREAVAGGAELLVAVGGDGTVHEVVNGLLAAGGGAELALIPRGTGSDLARTFRIPSRLEEAVRVALQGRARTIDLGRAAYRSWAGEEEEAYFVNVASVGMSGAVAKRVNEAARGPAKLSYLAALLAVFARWQPCRVRVSVAGEARAGPMYDVIVANGRYLAGGMLICPQAEPDDGLLDCLLIGDVSKAELLRTLPKVYRGTHLPHPKAELLRGPLVTVDADDPLPVELDGEQPGTTPARLEVVPRALRLRVPPAAG